MKRYKPYCEIHDTFRENVPIVAKKILKYEQKVGKKLIFQLYFTLAYLSTAFGYHHASGEMPKKASICCQTKNGNINNSPINACFNYMIRLLIFCFSRKFVLEVGALKRALKPWCLQASIDVPFDR